MRANKCESLGEVLERIVTKFNEIRELPSYYNEGDRIGIRQGADGQWYIFSITDGEYRTCPLNEFNQQCKG